MAIVINGSGTVTGISVGGLPDGIVDAGTLATNSVDSAELIDGSIDTAHIGTDQITSAIMPTGSVLQVVSATLSTETSSASRSWVTTGLDAAITPSSTSNKIFIYFNVPCYAIVSGDYMWVTLFRGTVAGTNLGHSSYGFQNIRGGDATIMGVGSGGYLDSPSTTSSQTYTVGFYGNSGTPRICNNDTIATITLMEIAG